MGLCVLYLRARGELYHWFTVSLGVCNGAWISSKSIFTYFIKIKIFYYFERACIFLIKLLFTFLMSLASELVSTWEERTFADPQMWDISLTVLAVQMIPHWP